jgi:hypothetical protein
MLATEDTKLLFHPMRNDYTMEWTAKEFKEFLKFAGHDYQLNDFPH